MKLLAKGTRLTPSKKYIKTYPFKPVTGATVVSQNPGDKWAMILVDGAAQPQEWALAFWTEVRS